MTEQTWKKTLQEFRKKHAKPKIKRKKDHPLNPLSDYLYGTDRCEGEARLVKIAHFANDVREKQAIAEDGRLITLGDDGAEDKDVDLINGQWHIQNDFDYEKIKRIRDKDMVLIEKLPRKENTLFEYWTAKVVGYNCFGPFVSKGNTYDYIVAKYKTDNGALWGYGKTIEAARAFLGLKLYDEYKEIIHHIACRNKLRKK